MARFPIRPHRQNAEEPPGEPLSEGLFSLRRRAPGPGGLASRMALAALALVLLFAMVIGVLAIHDAMRGDKQGIPNVQLEAR